MKLGLFLGLVMVLSHLPVVSGRESVDRPNILLILPDDLGKEWVGCYGAEDIATPNLDALAKGGMMFHNAYSMPQCTPSRVTLLTGKYPWRTGYVNHWDVPRWGVGYFDWKKPQNTTFARVMKGLGYQTAAAGKWQINDFRLEPLAMRKHGFDDWAMWTGAETGVPGSDARYQNPYINTPEGSRAHEGKFGPDVYADFLISFLGKHRDEPMCLYYPMVLPHTPLVATPDEPDAKSPLERHKAMVRYADKTVGRVIAALDELELRERTIVIITTDNGSTGSITGRRDGVKVRGAKASLVEAGTCQPLIVHCPGLVPAGVETDALTDFTDLFPTMVDLAGGTIPEGLVVDGRSIAPVILGKKQDSERDWILSMGHGPAVLDDLGIRGKLDYAPRVIRDKRYKVWVSPERRIARLHDLAEDPGEMVNLLASEAAEHRAALAKFTAVVRTMPEKDGRPLYEPRAPNPWDMKRK